MGERKQYRPVNTRASLTWFACVAAIICNGSCDARAAVAALPWTGTGSQRRQGERLCVKQDIPPRLALLIWTYSTTASAACGAYHGLHAEKRRDGSVHACSDSVIHPHLASQPRHKRFMRDPGTPRRCQGRLLAYQEVAGTLIRPTFCRGKGKERRQLCEVASSATAAAAVAGPSANADPRNDAIMSFVALEGRAS